MGSQEIGSHRNQKRNETFQELLLLNYFIRYKFYGIYAFHVINVTATSKINLSNLSNLSQNII